jgi:hypothetical protein
MPKSATAVDPMVKPDPNLENLSSTPNGVKH